MSDINITQTHPMSLPQSKEAAQLVADQLAAEFDLRTEWQGDALSFSREGIEGKLSLHPNQAQIEVSLGLLFKAFAPIIEEKLHRKMAQAFAATCQ